MNLCDKAERIGCPCATCARRNDEKSRLCCLDHPELLCKELETRLGITPGEGRYTCKNYREEE